MPDLAIGCLRKPFETDDLARALKEAEDILRGRQKVILRPRLPEQLQLYTGEADAGAKGGMGSGRPPPHLALGAGPEAGPPPLQLPQRHGGLGPTPAHCGRGLG